MIGLTILSSNENKKNIFKLKRKELNIIRSKKKITLFKLRRKT